MVVQEQTQTQYSPAGRLVSFLSPHSHLDLADLALSVTHRAAGLGETVLLVDCQDGHIMRKAGIIYHKTLTEALYDNVSLSDVLYLTPQGYFSAVATGSAKLEKLLGTIASLSLSYDWVFVIPPAGCTPAHVQLAGACDYNYLVYEARNSGHMPSFYMIETIRRRHQSFTPTLLSAGKAEHVAPSLRKLREHIREDLGGHIPYGGHIDHQDVPAAIVDDILQHHVQQHVA